MNPVLLLESERERPVSAMNELRPLELQVAKLSADVENIKDDIAEIKVNLRRLDDKIESKIDALRADFSSAKVWALGLYFGLAGSMLFVMAKGFKWI